MFISFANNDKIEPVYFDCDFNFKKNSSLSGE